MTPNVPLMISYSVINLRVIIILQFNPSLCTSSLNYYFSKLILISHIERPDMSTLPQLHLYASHDPTLQFLASSYPMRLFSGNGCSQQSCKILPLNRTKFSPNTLCESCSPFSLLNMQLQSNIHIEILFN